MFHVYGQRPPLNEFKLFLGTLSHLADVFNSTKFHLDQSRGIGLADAERMHFSLCKRSRP